MYSPSITEYDNKEIPKINLTVKEQPWNPSTNEYSEQETQILNHQGQISIPSTATRGPVFVSTVDSYSLAYDATDVMDNDNVTLEAQIEISVAERYVQKIINKPNSLGQEMGH